jgi:hypothetical protein
MATRPRQDSPSADPEPERGARNDDALRDDAAMAAALQHDLDALTPAERQQVAAMLEAKFGGGRTH